MGTAPHVNVRRKVCSSRTCKHSVFANFACIAIGAWAGGVARSFTVRSDSQTRDGAPFNILLAGVGSDDPVAVYGRVIKG